MSSNIYFENSRDPISDKDIKKFERKFKVKLPQDYKGFLLKYNGGTPNSFLFINRKRKRNNPLKIKQETECSIGAIYSLEQVKLNKNIHLELDEIPENLFQIAYDTGQEYICISMSGEDFGCIYYGISGDPHDNYEYMYHLADSFTEFLDGLQPHDE